MLEIEKKESKKNIKFSKTNKSPQYNQRRQSKSSATRGNAYQETEQELGISEEILVATIPR